MRNEPPDKLEKWFGIIEKIVVPLLVISLLWVFFDFLKGVG